MNKSPLIKNLPYDALGNKYGDKLWQCNLKPEDLFEILKYDDFWFQVALEWFALDRPLPGNRIEVKNQFIWLNSHIKVGGKVVWDKNCWDKGVICITDFLDAQNCWLSHKDFQNKYKVKIMFTKYYGLIDAVPDDWKQTLNEKENVNIDNCNLWKNLQQVNKLVSTITKKINSNQELLVNITAKWNRELQTQLTVADFIRSLENVNKVTLSTKLRNFHYKLMYRAVYTNIQLKYCKLKETDMCTFCEIKKETYEHLFYDCEITNRMVLKVGTKIQSNISEQDWFLNRAVTNPKSPKILLYCTQNISFMFVNAKTKYRM